jgi:hypothetical protein
VHRTPAPTPKRQEGYDFTEVYSEIDVSDLTSRADSMQINALRNVLSNNFSALISIFLHYAQSRQAMNSDLPGGNASAAAAAAAAAAEGPPVLAVTMRGLATLVRTCRLSSETCSFFEIQRAAVRPEHLVPTSDVADEWSLGLYEADFPAPAFFEALVRIANLKDYGLIALCDRVRPEARTRLER